MHDTYDTWLEIQADSPRTLREIYAAADDFGVDSIHHFQEPWFIGGFVVRVLPSNNASREDLQDQFAGRWIIWDATPDERLFGGDWPQVRAFFEASSRLRLSRGGWYERKLIHCALNSWGYSQRDELRFFLRMAWGRVRIIAHAQGWRLLRRRGRCKYGCHDPSWSRP